MTRVAEVAPAAQRPGLDVRIGEGPGPVVSPEWTLGAWTIQFVRLDRGQSHQFVGSSPRRCVKVVTGRLAQPERGAYPAVGTVRSTEWAGDRIVAGSDGALVAVFSGGPAAGDAVTSMADLVYRGPYADLLTWQTFESRFSSITPHFDGLDAHMSPGFHLLSANGDEVAYVWVWTAGPGVDMSTHNHGRAPGPTSPAFAEIHWVMHNGTGSGGMYETPAPGSPERTRTPMSQGEEHGPFFAFDPDSGAPRRRDNGAVEYPWHGWEAGPSAGTSAGGRLYDVVVAFEITAPYAVVTER
jgi:hypothetical protein